MRARGPGGVAGWAAAVATLGLGGLLASAAVALPGPSQVWVDGRQLMVRKRQPDGTLMDAAPYAIRGVCWSPASRGTQTTPADPQNAAVRRPEFGAWFQTDIPLLRRMNANTVRLFLDPGFDSTARAVLAELYRHDIMVVLTIDDAVGDTAHVRQAVAFYKDDPALLLWMIGNEWNVNRYYGTAASVLAAAERTQTAAALIHALDAAHPVATSYGDIDIAAAGLELADTERYVNAICPSVDVWGLNIYRGRRFGFLFEQWRGISAKPLFLAEFGPDAYSALSGGVDETAQAVWDLELWHELSRNVAGCTAPGVALGAFVFAWNDEWWKVPPAGSQEAGGYAGPHPDGWANEEYFGLVDIDRQPRQAYRALGAAFAPDYQPQAQPVLFGAQSAGAAAGSQVVFARDGVAFYQAGGGADGGRGFNLAAFDSATGTLLGPVQHFDTWGSRDTGTDMERLVACLDSLPAGALLLVAVADDAGLNQFDSCERLPYAWVERGLAALEQLGSSRLRDYCYRDSWAMVAVKGAGVLEEGLSRTTAVQAQAALDLRAPPCAAGPVAAPVLIFPMADTVAADQVLACRWQAVPGAREYEVQIAADPGFATIVHACTSAADTTCTVAGLAPGRTYWWRGRAIGAAGAAGPSRWSTSASLTVRPADACGATYELPAGWSLISLPCQVPDASLAALFPGVLSLFAYDGGYRRATALAAGRGYWINLPAATVRTVSGCQHPEAALAVDLPAGWSLVGPGHAALAAAGLRAARPFLQSVFGYAAAGGYQLADTLAPGRGYWVNLSAAGRLELGSAAAPSARPAASPPDAP